VYARLFTLNLRLQSLTMSKKMRQIVILLDSLGKNIYSFLAERTKYFSKRSFPV